MPLHRLLTIPKLSAATNRVSAISRFRPKHFARWQQTGSTGGSTGSSPIKVLFYGVTGVGIATVGSIAYANYDPAFKSKVDEYIPGFGRLTDAVSGKRETIPSSSKPMDRPEIGLGAKKDQVKLRPTFEEKSKTVSTKQLVKSENTPKTENQEPVVPPIETPSSSMDEKTQSEVVEKPILPQEPPQAMSESEQTEVASTETTKEQTAVPPIETIPELPPEPILSEPVTPQVEKQPPTQTVFPVESAVASVKEETEKVAEKIMSEQVKDHKVSQTLGEQWLKDSSKVDAKLQEVFEEFKTLSNKVYEAQKAVIEAARHHQQRLSEAIGGSGDDVETLAEDIASSEEAMDSKKKELDDAKLKHEENTTILQSLLNAAEMVGLKSKAEGILGEMSTLIADIQVGKTNIEEAESSSEVLEEYQEEARKSREQLQRELGTVPPKADLKQEAIILMQHKRIEVLKQKLEDIEQKKAQLLAAALDKQKQKLEQLADEKLKLNLQRQRVQMEQQFVRKETDIAHEFDSELREKLRLQSEAHTSYLTNALRFQADELGEKWVLELEMKLMEQEGQYQTELTKAMSRLRGIESMVNTVANAGEITRHQQSIRNACDTLSGALDQANVNPYDRYSFSKELTSLCEAARDDKFVLSIIGSIPQQASSTSSVGIQSEAGLKERFRKVYRICKRVALVPETGGGLGTYALSYLQSLLVFNIWGVKETQDIGSLDTFELLSLANDSMKSGDLERAVWYVNHLRDESRRVAQDWLVDARLYLETRQAIRLIQTYTAATNIAFIQ